MSRLKASRPQDRASAIRRLARNRDGNFAILFATALPLLIAGAGTALDFAQFSALRAEMQSAIDAATLASAASGKADHALARNAFLANAGDFVFDDKTINSHWATIQTISVAVNSDGNMEGRATGRMKTSLLGIIGITDIPMSVRAVAKLNTVTKIDKASFQITNAQGAYDKDIYFFTRDKTGKVTSSTLILQYDYTLKNGVGSKVVTPSNAAVSTVNVGDYASFGYQMVVYEDNSYRGQKINPKSYWSDDSGASKWTRTSGKCSDPKGQQNNWEDGGDSNFLDFVFTLKCTTVTAVSRDTRLLN